MTEGTYDYTPRSEGISDQERDTDSPTAAKQREIEALNRLIDAVARANGYDPFRDQLNAAPTLGQTPDPIPPLVALELTLASAQARYSEVTMLLEELRETLGLPADVTGVTASPPVNGMLDALEARANALSTQADYLAALSRRLREIV